MRKDSSLTLRMTVKRLPHSTSLRAIVRSLRSLARTWIPAFAGMTIICIVLAGCSQKPVANTDITKSPIVQKITSDLAFKTALNVYAGKKLEGMEMTNGPCLGLIATDWVLDIAHNPRQSVDDQPENQCEDYRNGTAHHFIEMDEDGKVIRSR